MGKKWLSLLLASALLLGGCAAPRAGQRAEERKTSGAEGGSAPRRLERRSGTWIPRRT